MHAHVHKTVSWLYYKEKLTYSLVAPTAEHLEFSREQADNSNTWKPKQQFIMQLLHAFVDNIEVMCYRPGQQTKGNITSSDLRHQGAIPCTSNRDELQSNFSGSNTFGTMKISSRQG